MDDSLKGDKKDLLDSCKSFKMVWNQVSRPFSGSKPPVVYDDLNEYDFSHPSRGVAIVINNKTFKNKAPRDGADIDGDNLKQVFTRFGFTDVRYHEDLTAASIAETLQKASKESYKRADCFVCAISSHGDEYFFDPDKNNSIRREEYILGTDLRPVLTRNMLEMFNDKNCPTLKGKPRIFLMQACRGPDVDDGAEVTIIYDEVDGLKNMDPYVVRPTPLFKDFIIVYATPPGFASFRRPKEGSWFVSALVECVESCDLETVSLTKLVTRVIHSVATNFQSSSLAHPSLQGKKQTPCFSSMLVKDVYFRSKT